MRALLTALLATTALTLPALADTVSATSEITSVTVYPQGAKITRAVHFDSPGSGAHELLVTDLPQSTNAAMMQIQGEEGISYGAFSLRADRLPPREEVLTPAQSAAKSGVEAAQTRLLAATVAAEEIQARLDAANARAGYLASISGQPADNATVESLRDYARVIGEETLAAARDAAQARADLWPAQRAVEEAQEALDDAEAALSALPSRDENYTALVVGFEAEDAGPQTLTVTHYVNEAGWRPFYDLHLSRAAGASIAIERSVLVTQFTGEDWAGIDLTLSSSRPSEQAAPSALWPWLRRIEKDMPPPVDMARAASGAPEMEMAAAPTMMVADAVKAGAAMEGDTVVYHYPRKVDIASGVEDLRLSLDRLEAEAEVIAVAVPSRDKTAFISATFTNRSGEPLLPGEALLYREGVLVGRAGLGLIAAGEESEIGFGALDSIILRRDMPQRDEGQTGVFTTSNQLSETAMLRIENLGTESWPIRVVDQVPYSEQQDLVVKTTISPAPSETDPEGQRGLLTWEFDLAAGETQDISLGYTLSWPDGMVLR